MLVIAFFATASAIFQLVHGIIGINTGFGMVVDLVAFPVLLAFFIFGFEEALNVCVLMTLLLTFISPETWLGASMKFAATIPMILLPALWLLAGKQKTDIGRLAAIIIISVVLPLLLFIFSGIVNTSSQQVFGEGNTTLYTRPELEAAGAVLLEGGPVTTGALLQGVAPILGLALLAFVINYLWKRYGHEVQLSSLSDPRNIFVVTLLAITVRGIAMVIANIYYAGPIFFGMQPEDFMASLKLEVPGVFTTYLPLWFLIFFWNAVQGVIEIAFAWTIAFKFKFSQYYGSL